MPEHTRGAEDDAPTVTLIVPVFNEASHIAACLDAIRAQRYPGDRLDIVVLDGQSTDATVDIVRRAMAEDPRIRLLENPEGGMAAGLNVGIRAARSEFVGAVSGHCALPDTYVSQMVDALERTGAWAVGGRIARRGRSPLQRAIAAATSSPIGVGDSAHNYAATAGWVETVFPGFWPRAVFDHVGLFDPTMIANEDNELSLRICKAGGRIWYDPSIEIEYAPRAGLRQLFEQYRRYAKGKLCVLRKHRGGLRWRHGVPGAFVAVVVAGGVIGVRAPRVRVAWVSLTAGYAALVVIAGLRLSERDVPWWQVARALVTLHAAYGIGTWQGLLEWRSSGDQRRMSS
jgi:succinoglycan biosynthesis protein ExoA